MFHLHYGNDIDRLAGDLARRLRDPCAVEQLLGVETVLVPHTGLQRWLQLRIAEINGVTANIRFLRPGELVWELLDAASADAGLDDQSPWDASRLRWHLLALFEGDGDGDSGHALPDALTDYLRTAEHDATRRFQLADEMASVFDKYQAWRRERVLRWLASKDSDDWQAQLFRQLHRRLRSSCRAALIDRWLRHAGAGERPPGLPSRLFVFACLNVSPDVLRMLGLVGQQVPTHFYMPTPCRAYWGDIRSEREQLRDQLANSGIDAFGPEENPLLARMGRAGRDFVAQIFSYELVQPDNEHEVFHEPIAEQSLLSRIQHDVLERLPPPTSDHAFADPASADDGSLRVHACHSRLREIEVLHDQLLAMLQPRADGSAPLRPRDIAVLAPDIGAYADAIHAVFDSISAADPRHIAYSLADQSLLTAHPLPALFLRLLMLPTSRHPLSETLDLLALPAMQERLDIDASDVERIGDWLHAAGVRWGRDGAARSRVEGAEHGAGAGAESGDAFSWRFGIDRLLLGMASGDDGAPLGDIAALDRIEGSRSTALDAVLQLNALIDRHSQQLARPKTPADWQVALNRLIDDLLPIERDDSSAERTLDELRQAISSVCREAAAADPERQLGRDTVIAALQQQITDIRPRQALLAGGVSFAGMVPLRCVPFRVIWVLGMNDGDYPRREPGGDLNRLLTELRDPRQRRIGDRSVRDDDRFLFLQLLCAAGERFHVSYVGFDPRSGDAVAPAAPVLDLLDCASACFADQKAARDRMCVAHPLQTFSPRLFDASDPRSFSYRSEWLNAANASRHPSETTPAFCALPLATGAVADSTSLNLDTLLSWSRLPPRAFVRDGLDLYLPRIDRDETDREPLALNDPLARSARASVLIDTWRQGQAESIDDAVVRLRARALLPPGDVGEQTALAEWRRLRPLWSDFHSQLLAQQAEPAALCIDAISGYRLQGELAAVGTVPPCDTLLLQPGNVDGRHLLDAWIQHLLRCVAAAGGDSLLFGLDDATARRWTLRALPRAQARTHLDQLLDLYRSSTMQPLPLLPKAAWRYVAGYRNPPRGRVDDESLRIGLFAMLWDRSNGWNGESDDATVQLAFRPQRFHELTFDDPLARQFRALAADVFEPLADALGDAELPT